MAIVRIPVKIEGTGQTGAPWMNVWNARTVSDGGNDFDEQVAEALNALETFYNSLKAYIPTGYSIRLGEGMIKNPGPGATYVNDDVHIVTATGTGNRLSPLLAVCISWRTTSATRSGRGRTFVGPLIEGTNEANGTPSAAVITGVKNAASALVTASSAPFGWSLGVYSQKQNLLRDFTSSSVQDRYAYLSSRRD